MMSSAVKDGAVYKSTKDMFPISVITPLDPTYAATLFPLLNFTCVPAKAQDLVH